MAFETMIDRSRPEHRHGAGGSNWIELDRTVGSLALFSLCFCVCFCFCFCVCVRVQPCSLLSLFLLREWKTAQTEES